MLLICRARKILSTRIFEDDKGKRWNLSVKDKGYEILCISQFTLYHVLKGNKLDFHNAMAAEKSEAFYQEFLSLMRAQYQADLIKGLLSIFVPQSSLKHCSILVNSHCLSSALSNICAHPFLSNYCKMFGYSQYRTRRSV